MNSHKTNLTTHNSPKSKDKESLGWQIFVVIIALLFVIPFAMAIMVFGEFFLTGIFLCVGALADLITNSGDVVFINIAFSFMTGVLLVSIGAAFFAGLLGFVIGKIIAKIKEHQDYVKLKSSNPYRFFKELPNHYGIGVTSILFDSTIENEKDIVATILDLCAQKNLHLERYENKYMITIRKTDLTALHKNEQYIMQLLIDQQINKIDYQKWFQYCLEDGVQLNLFVPRNAKDTNNGMVIGMLDSLSDAISNLESKRFNLSQKQINAIVFTIVTVLILGFIVGIITNIPAFFAVPFFGFFATTVTYYAVHLLKTAWRLLHTGAKQSYSSTLHKQVRRTEHGDRELQKLYAFRAFLQNFGSFVDRKPEEVTLWEHYLSYAQVFGVTKKIMQTGYDELINNTAFKIASIDAVNLHNITIQNHTSHHVSSAQTAPVTQTSKAAISSKKSTSTE